MTGVMLRIIDIVRCMSPIFVKHNHNVRDSLGIKSYLITLEMGTGIVKCNFNAEGRSPCI